MTISEYILFLTALSVAVILYLKVRMFGKNQKAHFEKKTLDRLARNLAKLEYDSSDYKVFTSSASSYFDWRQVNLNKMQNDILIDCTRSLPEGDIFGKTRFSTRHFPNSKSLYYVTGVTGYRFPTTLE
jgi:hypothetical protein